MKVFFIIIFAGYSNCFAANEIWLQDTDCKILSGDGYSVKVAKGSLITSICKKENIVITCSSTSSDGTMYNKKPSAINNYIDNDFMFWKPLLLQGGSA